MNRHVAKPKATHQDVLDAPPKMVAELIEGALHLRPLLAFRHALASSVLSSEIGGPFRRGIVPGGWWILYGPEFHFGDDVLVPDVAGWRRERMPERSDGVWTDLTPDWVCEVLSPSTRRLDLTDKRRIYADAGIAHLWFVDPLARTLEAFALRGGAWLLIAALEDDEDVRVPPFDAIAFPLSALWRD